MFYNQQQRRKGGLGAVAAIVIALFTMIVPASGEVHAINGVCRTDPIVFLSNGVVVRMTVDIQTDLGNISDIVYTLHAPAGTQITGILYTSPNQQPSERVVFYADLAADHYTTDTFVETIPNTIGVTASTDFSIPSAAQDAQGVASGYNNQHLVVQVNPW